MTKIASTSPLTHEVPIPLPSGALSGMFMLSQDKTAYSRKPRGVKPASDMSDRQQKAIDFIRQLTGAYFNGRSLSDVSTFIGLFLNRAKNKARRQAFNDWIIGDANSPW